MFPQWPIVFWRSHGSRMYLKAHGFYALLANEMSAWHVAPP